MLVRCEDHALFRLECLKPAPQPHWLFSGGQGCAVRAATESSNRHELTILKTWAKEWPRVQQVMPACLWLEKEDQQAWKLLCLV